MMVLKRKQIVVLSLVLMIVIAGYLQYSYNKSSSTPASSKDTGRLGEAVYVDSKDLTSKDQKDSKDNKDTAKSKAPAASKQANDFFTQTKMEKQVTRSKDVEAMKQITEDINAAKDVKSKAYEKMMKIVDSAEKEMRIESLIKEKGYNEAIALFGDDGSIDVIVEVPTLTSAQTAQISDIVSRQANLSIDKIHIKNMF